MDGLWSFLTGSKPPDGPYVTGPDGNVVPSSLSHKFSAGTASGE